MCATLFIISLAKQGSQKLKHNGNFEHDADSGLANSQLRRKKPVSVLMLRSQAGPINNFTLVNAIFH